MRLTTFFIAAFVSTAELTLNYSAFGQAGALTAEEQIMAASKDYAAAKWAEAAASFERFIKDYSARPEAALIIPKIRFPLAQCYLQLKKFPEAITAIDAALALKPPLSARELQELTFNKAVCLAQEEKHAEARATLASFIGMFPPNAWNQPAYVAQFPPARNVPEAQILIGTCLLLERKQKEAADYFAQLKPALGPAYRGRATVLQLYALLEAADYSRALAEVVGEYPRLDDMIQLATFETLTLEVGAQLLDRGEYRQAIACFSRIWTGAQIVERQEKRLADFGKALAAMNANPRSDPAQRQLLEQLAGKIRAELVAFKKIPNFDSALRLRLATAYQAMQRYRETALILEGMLNDLPADPIVEQASVSLVQCWGQIERWPKVIEAAEAFVKKFSQSKSIPLVRYLQGTAQQKELQFAEADVTFASLVKDYPKHDFASRGLFMQGLPSCSPISRTTPFRSSSAFRPSIRSMSWRKTRPFGARWPFRSISNSTAAARSWTNISPVSRRAKIGATLSSAKPTRRTPRGTTRWASRSWRRICASSPATRRMAKRWCCSAMRSWRVARSRRGSRPFGAFRRVTRGFLKRVGSRLAKR